MTNATTTEMDQKTGLYDMTNLDKMKTLATHAPEAMKAFVAFDKAAFAAGAIPVKYKELMALAVAFTTQCPYCIELHANKAREQGASDPEIAESVLVAAALRAGGAITHGTHAYEVNVTEPGGPTLSARHAPDQVMHADANAAHYICLGKDTVNPFSTNRRGDHHETI